MAPKQIGFSLEDKYRKDSKEQIMNHFEELLSLDPNGKQPAPRIEMPTPHRVTVLVLMKQYLAEKKLQADSGLFYPPQLRRKFCMLLLKLIQYPDMSYSDLHNMLTRYKIDPLHLEGFEKAMSNIFSGGIQALFDFAELQNIENMLCEKWGVSQFSMMGVYIRRVGVVLERLSFPEMMGLYNNFCIYYERGVRALAIGPRKLVPGGLLHRSQSPPPGDGNEKGNNTKKTDTVIDNIEHVKRPTVNEGEDCVISGGLINDDIVLYRNPLCKWSPKQAKLFVHQQRELLESNELRALLPIELQKTLNEIILDNPLLSSPYFLSYMNQLRVRDYFNAMDALHRAFDRSPVRMMSQEKGFQYFCLNLAVLHSSFGHQKEAIAALNEGIMLAQENNDKVSLSLANTWYSMLKNEDPIVRSSSLGGCKKPAEADELLLHSTSLALQHSVKMSATSGYQPLGLFDLLHRSDELIFLGETIVLDHASDLLAMRSAIWSVYGRHEMSSLYAQMLLNMNKNYLYGDVSNTESVGSVLSSFTLWLYMQGERNFALVLLQHARVSFPRYPQTENWMISQCHIVIQDGIFRCSWHEALKACDQLYLLDKYDGMLQRAAVYVAKRYYQSARQLLDRLLKEQQELPLLMKIRVLVLLAYCSMVDKCFSSEAMQLLLQASEETSAAQMDYEHALVDATLAQVLLAFDMPQKAFQAIKKSMNVIHINGGLYDRAKTDFVFVRCLMAVAGSDINQQRIHLQQSFGILERAVVSFKKMEAYAKVLDVYVYLAQCCNTVGERELRNKYAGKFRRYYTEHPIAREYLGMAY